jgi:outer membrane protein assembly factor BamB
VAFNKIIAFGVLLFLCAAADAGDWAQWRGTNRNGVAVDSPKLLDALPKDGLKPVWISEEIGSGKNDGGWGSPVVVDFSTATKSDLRVFLFTHKRIKLRDVPKKKFPWLAPDKRVGMTAKEYEEYEVKRRSEDEFIGQSFAFRETIHCLSAADGKSIWTNVEDSKYSRFPQSGSPTVVDGRLYILGAGRHVRCLNALTGDDIWNVRLPGEFRDEFWDSSFAVVDGVAVFLAGHLIAVELETGKVKWQGDPKKTRGTHSSPVVWKHDNQELVVVNVAGSETICVKPATGEELWRVKSEAGLATPVIQDDLLITYSNSRKKGMRCFRMKLDGAEEIWKYQGCQDKGSSPVIVDGHVFVQGEKRLACVDLQSGEEEWMTNLDLGRPQYTSLVAADSKVYYALEGVLCFAATDTEYKPLIEGKINKAGLLATEDAHRKLLKLDDLPQGKAEREYQNNVGRQGPVACASPAIANGRMFVRLKNAIACYDLRAN